MSDFLIVVIPSAGDIINAGDQIGYFEYFDMFPLAFDIKRKLNVAIDHIYSKIHDMNHDKKRFKRNAVPNEEIFLVNLFKDGQKSYDHLMKLLQQTKCDDSGDFFVRKEKDSYVWICSPAKGWTYFLAGLIFVCRDYDLLTPSACNNITKLVEVLKRSFNIEKLMPDSFNKLKSVDKSAYTKYHKPFEALVKRLSS